MNADEFRRLAAPGVDAPQLQRGGAPAASARPAAVPSQNWLGQQNAPRGDIRFIPGVDDFRTVLPDGTLVNPTDYERTQGGENFRRYGTAAQIERGRIKEGQERAALEATSRTQAELTRAEMGQRDLQIQGQLEQIRNQNAQHTASLQAQITDSANRNQIARDQLNATLTDNREARGQQANQFAAQMEQQTAQMQANNQLLDRKLTLEDQHFQQQMEYDRRANRRAQILGSLTLISQSLSRI